jgi:hypothetical protein
MLRNTLQPARAQVRSSCPGTLHASRRRSAAPVLDLPHLPQQPLLWILLLAALARPSLARLLILASSCGRRLGRRRLPPLQVLLDEQAPAQQLLELGATQHAQVLAQQLDLGAGGGVRADEGRQLSGVVRARRLACATQ